MAVDRGSGRTGRPLPKLVCCRHGDFTSVRARPGGDRRTAGDAGVAGAGRQHKLPERGDTVVVRGCLAGPSLQSTETAAIDGSSEVTSPVTYQLKGDKKLLKSLRDDLDGRMVKVTGVLKSSMPAGQLRREHEGRPDQDRRRRRDAHHNGLARPDSPPPLPVLEVKSYEGSATSCAK